jgi:hypothetical protein
MSRRIYAACALGLFIIEVLIALFMRDGFIRPYLGDALAVALVYAALRAATPLSLRSALIVTIALALVIEFSQAANLLGALDLADNAVARTVLGGAFDWFDLLAYAAGAVVIVIAERAPSRGGAGRRA